MIGILDYGVGNLLNLKNAIDFLKYENKIVKKINDFENCKKLLLPGVGAFSTAMGNLKKSNLLNILENKVINEKIPLLGICLGAQLLFEESSEGNKCKGLGWIPGKVIRFNHD